MEDVDREEGREGTVGVELTTAGEEKWEELGFPFSFYMDVE